MKITDRKITKEELAEIYRDFDKLAIDNGIEVVPEERYEYVAEENEIIGLASGLKNHNYFYLTDMWVKKEYRKQGLGKNLLTKLEDKARALGATHIWTWTNGYEAPEFYKSLGYEVFTEFKDFYENGFSQIGFIKKL